jgi:hypothetical protein
MSAATVIVTTEIARLLGSRALAVLPVVLWVQPWFALDGQAVLTEVPFSLTMAAACWMALSGRSALASVLFGLLPLVGHLPWSRPPRPRRLRRGALVVWDCSYSAQFGLRWHRLAASGFRELARFGGGRIAVLRREPGGSPLGPQPRCRV